MTTTKKTLTITISGGFHGVDEITVRAKIKGHEAWLSVGQIKRLDRHFCGIDGCMCPRARRADIDMPAGWIPAGHVDEYMPIAARCEV